MVAAILFGLLFVAVLSCAVVFVFYILSPALKRQQIPFERPLVSESEVRIKPSEVEKYQKADRKRAIVFCSGEKNLVEKRFDYAGPKSCALFNSIFDGEADCKFGCLGFGDCVKECSRHAISVEGKIAVVNELCNGCGKCVSACPKKIIKIVSSSAEREILCSSARSENTTCPAFLTESKIEIVPERYFQFWKMCYRMLAGKKKEIKNKEN
jgi:ferredoxin